MNKKLSFIFLGIINLIIIVILLFEVLFFTQMGLPILIKLSEKLLPGQLSIESSEGVFNKSILLKNIHYKNQNLEMKIQHLVLSWQPFAFFWKGYVNIKKVQIDNIIIENAENSSNQQNSSSTAAWSAYFKKLKFFHLKNAVINNINYRTKEKSYSVMSLQVAGDKNSYVIAFPKNNITGKYFFNDENGLAWKIITNFDQFDFSNVTDTIKGVIDSQLTFEGVWNPNNKIFTLSIPTIKGSINRNSLSGKVEITYTQDQWQFKDVSLSLADAFIKLNGIASAQEINLKWFINIPNLTKFYAGASGSFESQGLLSNQHQNKTMSAHLKANNIKWASFKVKNIDGDFSTNLATQRGRLNLTIFHAAFENYHFPQIKINNEAVIQDKNLNSMVNIAIDEQNYIRFQFNLDGLALNSFHQKINGKGLVKLNNFSKLSIIPKNIKKVKGTISANFAVNGYLDDLDLAAKINLMNASFFLPEYGTLIHAINIKASVENNHPVIVQGNFLIGNGRGNFNGTVNVWNDNHPIKIKLQGTNLAIFNQADLKVYISPDLLLQTDKDVLNVQGKIYVPAVNITKQDFNDAVTLPDEVEIVGRKQEKKFINSFSMQIKLDLGPSVFISNKDLKAQLSGHLTLSQIPGGLPTAIGELMIDRGVYRLRNQLLTITQGRLVYLGNMLTNPGLNIEAFKSITPQNTLTNWTKGWLSPPNDYQRVKVGASIRGTLDEPEVRLISEPPMSQDDIMSYLVFGHPRSQMGGMSSWGALNLFSTGLNIVGPTSSDGDDSTGSSPLGAIAMLNPTQVLNFSKALTKHFSIQTETGINETGIDLIYEYERE